MSALTLLGLLAAPSFFWAAYHYYKDRHRPEPVRYLLLSYGLGIAAGYLGLQAYALLDLVGLRRDAWELAERDLPGLLLYALLVIGTVEELAKFVPFWLIGMRLHHFDEPIDGIVYASFVALGFASYENFHYLPQLDGWETLGRAIAAPVVHVAFASIWGYGCGCARVCRPWPRLACAGALALAVAGHGLYDFVVIGLPQWAQALPPLLILALWLWRLVLLRRLETAVRRETGNPY